MGKLRGCLTDEHQADELTIFYRIPERSEFVVRHAAMSRCTPSD